MILLSPVVHANTEGLRSDEHSLFTIVHVAQDLTVFSRSPHVNVKCLELRVILPSLHAASKFPVRSQFRSSSCRQAGRDDKEGHKRRNASQRHRCPSRTLDGSVNYRFFAGMLFPKSKRAPAPGFKICFNDNSGAGMSPANFLLTIPANEHFSLLGNSGGLSWLPVLYETLMLAAMRNS